MPDDPDDPGEQPPLPTHGESAVIRALLGPGRPTPLRLHTDAGDDTAVLADGTLITTDTLVEGVHWDHRSSPADVGWKTVAVSASDVAAMGGRPSWATLALSLPRPLDLGWVHGFTAGLHAACAHFGVHLVGGDTTGSPGPRVATLTLGGHAARPVLRSGAQPGDVLWVTGSPGTAAVGFFTDGPGLAQLRRPVPPVELGAWLGEHSVATAMLDVSDGIATDLSRLCAASGVSATVYPERLPLLPGLKESVDPLPYQVAFGDDYELLFTASAEHTERIEAAGSSLDVRVTAIGYISAGAGAHVYGRAWPEPRFQHFEGAP